MGETDTKTLLHASLKDLAPDLDNEAIESIASMLAPLQYPSGHILVRQGEVASDCYFVIQGCLRLYFIDDNANEHCCGFYTEQESVFILDSFTHQKPSTYSIECLEDCILLSGNLQEESAVSAGHPAVQGIIQKALERNVNSSMLDLSRFRAMSPLERYRDILSTRPGLVERVPQYQLASYLGVTPESLSRIKKRLVLSDDC